MPVSTHQQDTVNAVALNLKHQLADLAGHVFTVKTAARN